MESPATSDVESVLSRSNVMTSAPSSPPGAGDDDVEFVDGDLVKEEEQARLDNIKAEEAKRREAAQKRKRKKKAETKAEREAKARELDELLMKSAAFSDILTKKTQALGRVGSSLDGKTLGDHNLQMARQPKCMVGGTMRDYQLEGLTWMFEICSQGMSGILADEMGLGIFVRFSPVVPLLTRLQGKLFKPSRLSRCCASKKTTWAPTSLLRR